jgi:hypothetical protein
LAYQSLFEVITRKGAERTPALDAFLDDLQATHGAAAAGPAEPKATRRAAAGRATPISRASAGSLRRSAAS